MGRVAPPQVVPDQIDINAPSAISGSGYFREPFPLNEQSEPPLSLAHPKGPASKLWIAQASVTPVSTTKKAVKPKPPPKTTPSTSTIKFEITKEVEIDIKVKVLADGTSSTVPAKSAKTSFGFTGVTWNAPGYSYQTKGGKRIVNKLNGKFTFKGIITIQTIYGSKAKATHTSLYGRGTTKDDKKNGKVTLGFHESCHQKDFLNYLKTKPLPKFEGKVGQITAEFDKASNKFRAAFKKYQDDMDKGSKKTTDEVGYKLSKCKADNKC